MTRGTGRMATKDPEQSLRAPRSTKAGRSLGRKKAGPVAAESSTAFEQLAGELGYEFADPQLLELALTHSSFIYEARLGRSKTGSDEPNQPGTDNEQLEFLGDAVLGLAVTELLLRAFPDRTEGELTRMRASLVSRQRMAEVGAALGLGPTLRMGKSAEASDGRQKPAVLANTAEALLGAVYLDVARGTDKRGRGGERALRTVRGILERVLVDPALPAIREALGAAPGRGALRDAKSRLQERVQAEAAGRLFYTDTDEAGPAHARRFTVAVNLELKDGRQRYLAQGEGLSKKAAQQAAAELALAQWGPDQAASKGSAPEASST